MASPDPTCTINGLTSVGGQNVTASSTVTIQLANLAGVNSWSISCIGTDETNVSSTITSSLVINTTTKTATFTAPAAGSALIFQSKVNGGVDINGVSQAAYTKTFGVYVPSPSGFRLAAVNETTEGDASYGWVSKLNRVAKALDAVAGTNPVTSPSAIPGVAFWLRSDLGITTVSGKVTQWNDQSGANIVANVAQATSANQFTYDATGGVNGLPRLQGSNGSQQMGSATSLFASGAPRTVFCVCASTTVGGSLITFRTANPYCSLAAQVNTSITPNYWYVHSDGITINTQLNPPPSINAPSAITFTYTGGSAIFGMRVNGLQVEPASQVTSNVPLSTPDTGTAGLTVGGRADQPTLGWQGDLYEFIVYSRILTEVEIRRVEAYIAARYSTLLTPSPSLKPRVTFDGDSITRGNTASTPWKTYAAQTAAALGGAWDWGNDGVDGSSSNVRQFNAPLELDTVFDSRRPSETAVLLIGTNDTAATSGPSTVYSNITSYVATRKAAGFKIFVGTVLGRNDAPWNSGMEANRYALNSLIRANTAGATGVIDFVADGRLNQGSVTYFSDGLHPNDAGYGIMAGIASNVILGVPAAWTPGSFTGLQLWLRADTVAFDTVASLTVATWTDRSSNGRSPTQVTTTARPVLISNWAGGQPAVNTAGGKSLGWTTNNPISAGAPYTLLMVGKNPDVGVANPGGGAPLSLRQSTTYSSPIHYSAGGVHYVFGDGVNSASNVTITPNFTPIQSPFQSVWVMNGTGVAPSIYINRTAQTVTAGTQTTENGTTGFLVGTNASAGNVQPWNGQIAEIVLLDHAASAAELALWNSYVTSRYGI